jgi:hypothetical protein
VELSTDAWRSVEYGGHMEMKDMPSRDTSLRKYYGVRVVANIFPVFSSLYFHLYRCNIFSFRWENPMLENPSRIV